VGGVDVVLERHRDAVQRAAHLTLRALAIQGIGLVERMRIHVDRGVQPILVEPEPHQILADDLARRRLAGLHGRLHIRHRRLVDAERRLLPRRRLALQGNHRQHGANRANHHDQCALHEPEFYPQPRPFS
jgi:hypothetical protein